PGHFGTKESVAELPALPYLRANLSLASQPRGTHEDDAAHGDVLRGHDCQASAIVETDARRTARGFLNSGYLLCQLDDSRCAGAMAVPSQVSAATSRKSDRRSCDRIRSPAGRCAPA